MWAERWSNRAPGAVWRTDETIQLPGELRLALEVDGDPQPAPRPESHFDDGSGDAAQSLPLDAAAGTAAGAASKKSKSSLVQLGIIGVCILGIAGLLMMKNSGGAQAAPDRPTFNELVQASLTKDDAQRTVVQRLQYAQAALVRGNGRLARQRFLRLRDQLVQHDDSLSAEDQADLDRIRSYVEYRLGQLP